MDLNNRHSAAAKTPHSSRHWPLWILYLAVLLNIAWPMQHSVAIRNILLLLLLMVSFAQAWRQHIRPWQADELKLPGKLYLALTGWLLATVLLADDPLNSLNQYRGEWLMATLALLTGLLCARLAQQTESNALTPLSLTSALAFALAVPALLVIGNALLVWVKTHVLPFWDAPLLGRTAASEINNMLYGILIADALSRSARRPPLLLLSKTCLALALLLVLVATYLLNTRNSTIGILLMTLFALSLLAWQQRQRINKLALLLAGIAAIATIGWYAHISYRADARWTAFNESVEIAMDTEHNKAWLNTALPLPLMSNGQHVDHSAYMRMAWAKEGALAILDYPLGVGFGRNAFGHAMLRKYGIGRGHSHSGLIDFALSGGIPGLLLWLGFSAVLLRFGWRSYFRDSNPTGLALTLLIAGTLFRMIVDSNLRDHGLEQYLFLLAVFAVLTCRGSSPAAETTT
jgi:hypothetical protein